MGSGPALAPPFSPKCLPVLGPRHQDCPPSSSNTGNLQACHTTDLLDSRDSFSKASENPHFSEIPHFPLTNEWSWHLLVVVQGVKLLRDPFADSVLTSLGLQVSGCTGHLCPLRMGLGSRVQPNSSEDSGGDLLCVYQKGVSEFQSPKRQTLKQGFIPRCLYGKCLREAQCVRQEVRQEGRKAWDAREHSGQQEVWLRSLRV